MPRSSSCIASLLAGRTTTSTCTQATGEGEQRGRCSPSRHVRDATRLSAGLRLAGRGDLDRAGRDVGLDLVQVGLDVGRHGAPRSWTQDQAGAVVASGRRRSCRSGRCPLAACGDVLLHRVGQALGDAAEEDLAVLRSAHAAVGVDPEDADLAADVAAAAAPAPRPVPPATGKITSAP